MKKNMGTLDRIIRIILALVVIILYFADLITGTAAVILGIIAFIFVITSAVGSCPLYIPLNISTKKQENDESRKNS